jgi:apolipoprotein D and lipocalin family protein
MEKIMKRITSVVLPVAALVVALSAKDVRAQSNPWSVSFDLGTHVALSGDVHGGGSGTVLSLPTQVQARSYRDIYGSGFYWSAGLGYRVGETGEIRVHGSYTGNPSDRLQVGTVAGLPLAAAPAHTPPPVRAVPFVDLDRYAGDWFEIARFPNRFQRQCVADVRATYGGRPDGRVDVVNRCRTAEGETEARGVARIVDERTFAKLKVRFAPAWLSLLPMVWGDYWIIGLAPDYSWAVVGDPGRDYLWILARAPHLDDASTAVAQAAARDNGFDVTRLVPTSQAGAARP